ncbi:type II secretion system GspH family protein [Patescibacteria group bacterium]|nr:type II secretion system GspH family protein [Patescibacteria group bacterium]
MRNKKGFTLIELLVAASILGVMMMAGIVIYQGAKKAARDARRREDLLGITKGMEQYYAIAGRYPAACPGAGTTFNDSNGQVIFDRFPDDPDPILNYNGTCDSNRFCFSALLENVGKGNCSACSCPIGGTSCSLLTANSNYFCVKYSQ